MDSRNAEPLTQKGVAVIFDSVRTLTGGRRRWLVRTVGCWPQASIGMSRHKRRAVNWVLPSQPRPGQDSAGASQPPNPRHRRHAEPPASPPLKPMSHQLNSLARSDSCLSPSPSPSPLSTHTLSCSAVQYAGLTRTHRTALSSLSPTTVPNTRYVPRPEPETTPLSQRSHHGGRSTAHSTQGV